MKPPRDAPALRLVDQCKPGKAKPDAPAPHATRPFGQAEASQVLQSLAKARSLVLTVRVALAAVKDGAWAGEAAGTGASHWGPVIALVMDHLERVRDIALGTSGAPPIDWPDVLLLSEAIAAGLWFDSAAGAGQAVLGADDLDRVLHVLVEEIEATMGTFEVFGHEHLPVDA